MSAPAAPIAASGPASATAPAPRQVGIDLARGLAVLLMIQTHAYDGWVSAAGKHSLGYSLSRAVSNIPAPLFLLLAGVGLALGAQGALRRGKSPAKARASLMRRALEVVGYGYLVSAIYMAIEWRFSRASLLRADILHCIGLSLFVCTLAMVARGGTILRAALITVLALCGGLWLGHLLPPLGEWLKPIIGLFIDVPGYTRFPLLPLVGFCAIGYAVAPLVSSGERKPVVYLVWAAAAVLLALVFGALTNLTLARLGGKLSRSHPAVIWNFFDGTFRALAVLALGRALGGFASISTVVLPMLVRLGRGSLLAYAVHIPFCYGRLATPWAGKLSMAQATPLVLLLMAATFTVVYLRDRVREHRA